MGWGGGGGVVEGREVSLLHASTQLIYGCGALNVGGGLQGASVLCPSLTNFKGTYATMIGGGGGGGGSSQHKSLKIYFTF